MSLRILLLMCLMPGMAAGQSTEERAAKIQQDFSRPTAGMTMEEAAAHEEELLNLFMEAIIYDFAASPELRGMLPAERPRVKCLSSGSRRTPYVTSEGIVFPLEYFGYLNFVGVLAAHDAFVQHNFFPIEKNLLNTPFRERALLPLMDPLNQYLEPEVYGSIQNQIVCVNDREGCQRALKNGIMATDLFPLLHELSHLALHHAANEEGINVDHEIAADRLAFSDLKVISARFADPDIRVQKSIRFVYALAPLVWLRSEASRGGGSEAIANARYEALLAELDSDMREDVRRILTPERSPHNTGKWTITWDASPETLFIDGVRVLPADINGKALLLTSKEHTILALTHDSLGFVRLDPKEQNRTVKLTYRHFEVANDSGLNSLLSEGRLEDVLVRTTDVNLQPKNGSVAIYHWKALHQMHLDSLIDVENWDLVPENRRSEVVGWHSQGQLLASW